VPWFDAPIYSPQDLNTGEYEDQYGDVDDPRTHEPAELAPLYERDAAWSDQTDWDGPARQNNAWFNPQWRDPGMYNPRSGREVSHGSYVVKGPPGSRQLKQISKKYDSVRHPSRKVKGRIRAELKARGLTGTQSHRVFKDHGWT